MNYPTAETDAFEAAIKAAPDDDAPLLVYADWLQEHEDYEFEGWLRNPDLRASVRQWAITVTGMGGYLTPRYLRDYLRIVVAIRSMDLTTVKWEGMGGAPLRYRITQLFKPKVSSSIVLGTTE